MGKTNTQTYNYAKSFLGKGGSIFRKYCGLPSGAAWCNAFVTYIFHKTDNAKLYCKGKEGKETKKSSIQQPAAKEVKSTVKESRPVFKIQIMASDIKLKSNDKRFKGLKTGYYREKGFYKYTYGESEDYNEIVRLKKQISSKFKDAFIIAFLDNEKINTQKAIEMFKKQTK